MPRPAWPEQLFEAIKLLDNVGSIDFYLVVNLTRKRRFLPPTLFSTRESAAGQNDDIKIMRSKNVHVRYLAIYLNLHLPNYDVKYRVLHVRLQRNFVYL